MSSKNSSHSTKGDVSSHNIESVQLAPSSDNSLPIMGAMTAAQNLQTGNDVTKSLMSTTNNARKEESLLALPAHWFGKNRQELLKELGQLSRTTLLTTLAALLENGALPRQTRCVDETLGDAQASIGADALRGIDWGPEYNTRQLAEMCGISRQAVAERVHKLVANGWLEERCTKRWSFDAEEGAIIRRNPRTRGPIKKYSA